jgi:hypothetical protein
MKHRISFTTIMCALALVTIGASGQRATQTFHSGISGRVTDRNGAVVMRARITIVAGSSKRSVIRMTNDEGQYVADLEPDTYDVSAEANGFKTAYRKSIPVSRDSRSYVDFVLQEAAAPSLLQRVNGQGASQQIIRSEPLKPCGSHMKSE